MCRRIVSKFASQYAEFARKLNALEAPERGVPSPGVSFALASRGPIHSLEAEIASARARWSHMSMAFPSMGKPGSGKEDVFLISVQYTPLQSVRDMQQVIGTLLRGRFHSAIADDPRWIEVLGNNFDALRHPQLAIANAAFYTFPFFLTWQRRHQWGVLPYGTHDRLGVIVSKNHRNLKDLQRIEEEYIASRLASKASRIAHWNIDARHSLWLDMLLEAAEVPVPWPTLPSKPDIVANHKSATLFTVGAYLYKELLPLSCIARGARHCATSLAQKAIELDPGDLSGMQGTSPSGWHANSAVIVDLAVCSTAPTGFKLFRLPHNVYIPVGIGYSVQAVPLLLNTVTTVWVNDLVRDAGQTLLREKDDLLQLGIDIDDRFWKKSS